MALKHEKFDEIKAGGKEYSECFPVNRNSIENGNDSSQSSSEADENGEEVLTNNGNEILEREKDVHLRTLQLMKESNVTITQINGQRRLGPPAGWTGPPPTLNCEIFVGRVPRTVVEADLYPVFRSIGEVYEMRLMMDFSGMTRGYCFVMYTNPNDAARAAKELDQYEIVPGKKIGVVPSVNNCRLYVGYLPPHVKSKIFIQKTFMMNDSLEKISVFRQPVGNLVFALLYFKTHRDAAIARRKLLADFQTAFFGKFMIIEWAYPHLSPSNVNIRMTGIVVLTKKGKRSCIEMLHAAYDCLFAYGKQ